MPRRRSPVRTRSRRSARRSPKSRRSARRSPHRSPKRSPKRRSPKRRTVRTFRAVGDSVTMTGRVSGAVGTGTVASEDRKTIVVKNVSYVDENQFSEDELVTFDPPKQGDWKVTEISDDTKTITLNVHVDVEMLERQTSSMSMLSPRLELQRSRLVGAPPSTPADTPANGYAQPDLSDEEEELAYEPSSQGETRAETTVPSSLGDIVPGAPRKRRASDDDVTRDSKSARSAGSALTQRETP